MNLPEPRRPRAVKQYGNPFVGTRLTRTYWLHRRPPIEFVKVLSEPVVGPSGFTVTVLRIVAPKLSVGDPRAGPIQMSMEVTGLKREWLLVPRAAIPVDWQRFLDATDFLLDSDAQTGRKYAVNGQDVRLIADRRVRCDEERSPESVDDNDDDTP